MRFAVMIFLLVCGISSGYSQENTPKPIVEEKAGSQGAKEQAKTNKKPATAPTPPTMVFIDATTHNPPAKDDEKPEAKKERSEAELTSFKATHANAWLAFVLAVDTKLFFFGEFEFVDFFKGQHESVFCLEYEPESGLFQMSDSDANYQT